METPEGRHRPGKWHDGFGDRARNIVNGHHYKLDTFYAIIGLTLHQQSQGVPMAVPSVFQLP